MAYHINSTLTPDLEAAYKLIDTLVLRTKSGHVFTIEVGQSLLAGTATHGAKVTLHGHPQQHVGICQGTDVEDVVNAAQGMIADKLAEGIASAVPKPHISTAVQANN